MRLRLESQSFLQQNNSDSKDPLRNLASKTYDPHTSPYLALGQELRQQQKEIKAESKQSTVKYVQHKLKRMFTFKREDALPAVRLSVQQAESVNRPEHPHKSRIFSSKTKAYEWNLETAKEVTALWHTENFAHRDPAKIKKVSLARAFFEMREHQRGKEKHEKWASVWWSKDKWRCDAALDALLDAFNNPVTLSQLKNGMAAGGTGYDHRGKAIWAMNASEMPGVTSQVLKLTTGATNHLTVGALGVLTGVLTAFGLSQAILVGDERFKNKPRERLSNEMDPQSTESLSNAPAVGKLPELTKELQELIEDKKILLQKKNTKKEEILDISLKIKALEVKIKSRGINTATEVQGIKRQMPARLTAGLVKSAGAGLTVATFNPIPLIASQAAATVPHLIYHFSGAEDKDSEDKGYAKMLGVLKSPEFINTKEVTRDEIADLYKECLNKDGSFNKDKEKELEKQLANAFNLNLITQLMSFPVGGRLGRAEKMFKGKISRAIKKLSCLEQKEKNTKIRAQYEEEARLRSMDFVYLSRAINLQKEAQKAQSDGNDLLANSLLENVAKELSKITDKDFPIMFYGSLLEQAKVDCETEKFSLNALFSYRASYGANGAINDLTQFNVGAILSVATAHNHFQLAAGQPAGTHFPKLDIKQVTSFTMAGSGHVSGWRANDKKTAWGKEWAGALLPKDVAVDHTPKEIELSEHMLSDKGEFQEPFKIFAKGNANGTTSKVELSVAGEPFSFTREDQPLADELWKKAGFKRRMKELRWRQLRTVCHLVLENLNGAASVLFDHKWMRSRSSKGRMDITKSERRQNDKDIGTYRNEIQQEWYAKVEADLNHPEYLHMQKHGDFFVGMPDWLEANRVDLFNPDEEEKQKKELSECQMYGKPLPEIKKKKYDKEARLVDVKVDVKGFDDFNKLLAKEAGMQNHFIMRSDNGHFFAAKRKSYNAEWTVNGRSLKNWFAEAGDAKGRSVREIAFVYPTQSSEELLNEIELKKKSLPELEKPYWRSIKLKEGAPEVPVGAYLGMDLEEMFKDFSTEAVADNVQRAPVSTKNQQDREAWNRHLHQRMRRGSSNL